MSKPYRLALFIFRRDLRLEDNSALAQALADSEQVAAVFIFDPRQVDDHEYHSRNALQFMVESLVDLDARLRELGAQLHVLAGRAEEVVAKLLDQVKFEAVYINADYTPFSRKRDAAIAAACKNSGRAFCALHDALLFPPGEVHKSDGKPYTVFTPFFRAAQRLEVAPPRPAGSGKLVKMDLPEPLLGFLERILRETNEQLFARGGRASGLALLRRAATLTGYDAERNFPAVNGTSGLSAHLKFGTVSVREVYHEVRRSLGAGHSLIRQLFWRDFFVHIAWHFPEVFGAAFHKAYRAIPWENNEVLFAAWCEGKTGFPLVDAGMRQLNATGYMHNRMRMVTASFLVKDLLIDWRWGERYFARQLVDYDPAVNNGNWQWAASTGCDAQPYFRIFNPWLQQKKFDPECVYIKRWIPELADLSPKRIHDLGAEPDPSYPAPVIDHAEMKHVAEELFRSATPARR